MFDKKTKGIAVIGGANVDIKGISASAFVHGSSNPGVVYRTAGGVARNIAENLGRLDLPVTLYSVVGNDPDGDWLIHLTNSAGVNTSYMKKVDHRRTGIYLSVLNEDKEQVGSIADMEIFDAFSKEYIDKIVETIDENQIVFIDSNHEVDSLQYIFEILKDKDKVIVSDPVSVKKAARMKDFLHYITLITPNKEEAEILTGIKINETSDLHRVADALMNKGIKQIVITLGAQGVYAANSNKNKFFSTRKLEVADTTGAGDAFLSGLIYGIYKNIDLFEACYFGMAMAELTLQRNETVASDLNLSLLENRYKELKK